tara:strand:- start:481 stop:1689 length:1209 start_codon:yes stop_codon:yes gene_type:complete
MIMGTLKLFNIGNMVTYSIIDNSMISLKGMEILISEGKIIEIGSKVSDADQLFDCENKLVTPGFVDCHTHPVFLDGRENEFEMRLRGLSYEEIADRGGGINNSVSGVRNSSKTELYNRVISRVDKFLKLGTTTIEAKSGYGLDIDSELKSLKVLGEVNLNHQIDIVPTFMGAHAVPKEYADDIESYVDLICDSMIPQVAEQGIAVFNDVFCEKGYFNLRQSERILKKGLEFGLLPRIHSDEFNNLGASKLAGKLNFISADHLMKIEKDDIEIMADSNTKAVLLPGTTFFLGHSNYAPYGKLKDAGIEVAIATDYNPGSCNIQSMIFIITIATIFMKMDIIDALCSSTFIPAKLLNIEDVCGSIEQGKSADIIVWDIYEPIQIPYHFSTSPLKTVIKSGKIIF